MSATPTPEELEAAVRRSLISSAGGHATAARHSEEWLRARAKKGGEARARNLKLKRAIEEALREQAGLQPIVNTRRRERPLPTDDLLRPFFPQVDREQPGLDRDARRRAAARHFRAERARLEAQ